MAGDKQGGIDASSDGGVLGVHPPSASPQFLVAPATSSEVNTVRLRLIPIACWRVDDIRFAFDSSFVAADSSSNPADTPNDIRAELQSLVTLVQSHPGCPLSVFGHADPVGDDDYNKLLSGRRATAIYALLIFNSDSGTAVKLWSSIASKENWGSNQREMMQSLTGLPIGTQDYALIQAYLHMLCPPALKLTKTDFLAQGADSGGKGDYQGCSEFNPLLLFSKEKQDRFDQAARGDKKNPDNQTALAERNASNALNRRVLILMFRKGSRVDPAKWPCPTATDGTAACKKRFWSDGEVRRSVHPPGADRKFQETQDTFACRFYQRISGNSPCHAVTENCWPGNYEKEISTPSYGRYSQPFKKDGTPQPYTDKVQYKLYTPVKTGSSITVEIRFKAEPQSGVTAADVAAAKTKLETGVETYWNDRFTLEAEDPTCGKKSFLVKYKVVWVSSGQHYTVKVHTTYPREGVTGDIMDVSRTTSDWTYAHEVAHCFGLPDEYSYTADTETVRYFKPDGTLDAPISAPPGGKSKTAPDATIMSAVDNTIRLERHGWNIAIETQELLTAKLGRKIRCSIK
jgi:type VI secretion system secreted protein VgrG